MQTFAILGGSGSGKTALSLEIATSYDCVILSLDSLSIYQEIDIASAKPSLEERKGIVHFGIDILSPKESQNVYNFIQEYYRAKDYCQSHKKPLLIVGGTGFYLKSLLVGLSPAPKLTLSEKLEIESKIKSLGGLDAQYRYLCVIDSVYANKLKPQDSYRIARALEIYFSTHCAPSVYFANHSPKPILESCTIFEILRNRECLRQRILMRTQEMLDRGLLEEVQTLYSHYGAQYQWAKSIGIKETLEYLKYQNLLDSAQSTKNDALLKPQFPPITSLESLRDSISTHTAQLAKRQTTFNKTQFPPHFCGTTTEIYSQITMQLRNAH
ncbi:tRNA (adenosine(37)-N6)-dimethylallyltransferase MiaA [Helicobacter sp. MIT 05-5294]|uniref:tRNA (adenosine(37)-N6)-dimethylallyltransferase MiaA n=1 Tax=Helicobacter sp. MIT 05-5294 TaxID=1548150 RepID=UPI0010FF01CA|nr:tRNA (adenosine(37)-N6)-dimethylallyltransferase MiaA [Helicobacter sp. MIT 05-5294]TLD85444.1 tRNA (adenosine(37)-N6)-dimethylallyltransferase MiaA [Helicobacter sp. MIT 05-5294]